MLDKVERLSCLLQHAALTLEVFYRPRLQGKMLDKVERLSCLLQHAALTLELPLTARGSYVRGILRPPSTGQMLDKVERLSCLVQHDLVGFKRVSAEGLLL
ncbi:hypothetical protein QE152_g39691 [Popillia japonica]|uniref:Uncharacterized protein n=1 Tax=Popillia japonica TaxID=7064 RepID=A0AAW1HTG2_POPJA